MKLSYYNTTYNFGDLLNITILKDLFGVKELDHCFSAKQADMIAIGSLFERLIEAKSKQTNLTGYIKEKYKFYSTPKIEVFGTGFIKDHSSAEIQLIRRLNVVALRGKFTKEKLDLLTNKNNKSVLGDPGLLCSELINSSKVVKKYKLGIIPHYADKSNKLIFEIEKNSLNSKIIDIQQEPYSFLKELSQCDAIISSAMHGLIAADSLNIPNLRLIVSDKLTGGDFKFHDYYSVFDVSDHKKLDLFNNPEISNLNTSLIDHVVNNFVSKSKEIHEINQQLCDAFKRNSKYA